MELYFHSETNVGDQLNSWLWESTLGVPVQSLEPQDALFIGIGTILRESIPSEPKKKFVMGAGCGYEPPPKLNDDWNVVMVRGPLTAKTLGVSSDVAVTDPGVLIRDYYSKDPSAKAVGFMPHYSSGILCDWVSLCEQAGVVYLDPTLSVDRLMEQFTTCKLIITEAMHGAIMADALRIPWRALKTRGSILTFKWQDWASSLGMEVKFTYLPPPYRHGWKGRVMRPSKGLIRMRLRQLASQEGCLSETHRLDEACEELHRRIKQFRDQCCLVS
ncbi:polysaccharide pyruvyl transferase family protein [Rhodopirellula sp. MGV]|uniref:polysaccharide pyruvyl transferase family protein n=1 Tax=Rhodopirellula sp. MGV TaxID=2023130 RepID=UPI000B96442E|nr:polysaccharide pyruvyl transferase family protein [Rhodopirellula sp. MGV]OYP34102.1 hypothetical protein CGZ80_16385 [Rhodopirellula sp. MGV]PNY35615.1 succinoglycan biosynthesis protein exov [Rhodopirellula baltica]